MSEIEKILVIGWDGATWAYIDPLLERGLLPNLHRLQEQGVRYTLRSTIPPFTTIAWPTLLTGCTPAGTGVYDAVQYHPGSYTPQPARISRNTPIWQWLSRFGLRSGVINVPMTYPASILNGYLVSGFDSPRNSPDAEFPRGVSASWAANGQPYNVLSEETALMDSQNPHQPRGDLEAFTSRWVELTRQQGRLLNWLWQHDPVDLLFSVFSGTDSINHRTRENQHIEQVYQAADQALGDVLNATDERTLICLVSDHGSTPAWRYIALNRILSDHGWLHYKKELASRQIRRAPSNLGEALSKAWGRIPPSIRRLASTPFLKVDPRLGVSYENLDWERTKIFARSSLGPLYVNLQGRFPNGCVPPGESDALLDEVSSCLFKSTDEVGTPLFKRIYRGRELYPKPTLDYIIPDLILEPYDWGDHMISGYPTDPPIRPIPDEREYGTHTPDGIFLLAGPGIITRQGNERTNIQDVVPTLLAALDLPLPDRLDGKVLKQVFDQPRNVRTIPSDTYEGEQRTQTDETANEVLDRLRALGYLE